MSESTPPSGQYSPASDLLCNSKCDWKPGFGSRGSASPAEKRGKRQLRARRSCLPVLTDYLLWACRFEPKRSICEKPTLPWEGGDLVVKTNHLLPSLPTDCLLFFFSIHFWLLWVFIAALGLLSSHGAQVSTVVASLVAEHSRACTRFSSWGSWAHGSVVVAHRLSCPEACRIFLDQESDQESNLCPLHW